MSLNQDQLLQADEHFSLAVRALGAKNADLKAEIDYLKRLIQGARSEKLATIDPTPTSLISATSRLSGLRPTMTARKIIFQFHGDLQAAIWCAPQSSPTL